MVPRPSMLVIRRTTIKAVKVITRPMRPLVILVEAADIFLGSPELNINSQPARMRLTKKKSPVRTKTRLRRLTLLERVSRSVILAVRGMLVAGLGSPLMLAPSAA